jgi:hypothetical protein
MLVVLVVGVEIGLIIIITVVILLVEVELRSGVKRLLLLVLIEEAVRWLIITPVPNIDVEINIIKRSLNLETGNVSRIRHL